MLGAVTVSTKPAISTLQTLHPATRNPDSPKPKRPSPKPQNPRPQSLSKTINPRSQALLFVATCGFARAPVRTHELVRDCASLRF